MQVTRSSLDTAKGRIDWFTGDVYARGAWEEGRGGKIADAGMSMAR